MNRLIALILIILFAPLFIIIAILLLLEDGFPIFFKQERFGRNNHKIIIYKFRSMKNSTPNIETRLLENPKKYLLFIGSFIRKYSLDELPNLINVLKGDMNFIGPRPSLISQIELQKERTKLGIHTLKPGITGWAQVNGRDDLIDIEKIFYEQEYLKKKNFWLDAKIIIYTVLKAIKKEGISH